MPSSKSTYTLQEFHKEKRKGQKTYLKKSWLLRGRNRHSNIEIPKSIKLDGAKKTNTKPHEVVKS